MKNLFFIFCFLLSGQLAQAQFCNVSIELLQNQTLAVATATGTPPFSYTWHDGFIGPENPVSIFDSLMCVTITDSDSCSFTNCISVNTTDGCYGQIFQQPTTTGLELYVESVFGGDILDVLWTTGETGLSIVITEAGSYCAVIAFESGCVGNYCVTTNSPQPCNVDILTDSTAAEFTMTADMGNSGIAPFAYTWNNGSTSQSISVVDNGTYCVTVTDAIGCTTEECFVVDDFSCSVGMTVTGDNLNGYEVCAVPNSGAGPFSYVWTNGETTDCITLDQPGSYTYGVTMTDDNGCQSSYCCLSFTVLDYNYQLSGSVYPQDTVLGLLPLQGWAYRIELNDNGTASLIDSIALQNSPNGTWYDFGEVDEGEYIVKVALTENSPAYEDLLPSYHYSHLTWQEANPITIPHLNNWGHTVELIMGDNPGGAGGIYGDIITGDGLGRPDGSIFVNQGPELTGEAISNISVLLFDENDQPVAHTLTNGNGLFAFENIAFGTYKVQVDIIGLEEAHYFVTIDADNPNAENLTFVVTDSEVTTDVTEIEGVDQVTLFPNPVDRNLVIAIESTAQTTLTAQLINVTGQIITSDQYPITNGQQNFNMNTINLPSGIYMLQLTDGNGIISKRIVKR